MSLRTITYNFNGAEVSPDTAQYGGVRFEDNATAVQFILDNDFKLKIEQEFPDAQIMYRIDFNGEVSGYNPSENLTAADNKVTRAIPLCMTAAGEQITAVLVVTALDNGGEAIGTVSSLPVKIYFDNVSRDETDGVEIAENLSAIEEKTKGICVLANNFSNSAAISAAEATAAADSAEEAMLKTEEARFALENGADYVFLGGNARAALEIDIAIDDTISEVSENLLKNRAISAAISTAKEELKAYTDNEIATFNFIKIVDTLPDEGLPNRLYLIPKSDAEGNDLFDEYIWANGAWEFITTKQIEIDLTPFSVDYIVEEGTSGVWSYRKWNSGLAECWGKYSESVTCTELRNAFYVASVKKIPLPEGLFAAAPMANLNTVVATGYDFFIPHIHSIYTDSVWYIPASADIIPENAPIALTLSISAKGKWK